MPTPNSDWNEKICRLTDSDYKADLVLQFFYIYIASYSIKGNQKDRFLHTSAHQLAENICATHQDFVIFIDDKKFKQYFASVCFKTLVKFKDQAKPTIDAFLLHRFRNILWNSNISSTPANAKDELIEELKENIGQKSPPAAITTLINQIEAEHEPHSRK